MDPDSYLSTFLTSIEVLPITSGGIFALFMAFLCLVFSGFVSASEIAFFSLSPQDQAEIEEEKKTQDVLIKNLLARSEYLLATILIANNLVNVAVVMLCNFFISETIIFRSPVISFLFQVVILTFLLLLFGEIMPKIYAKHNSLTMARRAAGVLTHLEKMFRWLSWALIKSTHIINKHISRKNTNLSMNELSQALEMTQVDENEEKEMLEGIIKFGGKTVEEIMTSRVDMTDIDIRISLSSLIKIIVETGYSRLPVYEGSQDNIKGIIYIKDLLPYIKEKDFDWSSLLRPAYFVPETKMIDDLLEEFRKQKIHMAIVVDEFGGTSGIVTMEDILEEIVGDILDEYDEDEITIRAQKDNSLIIDGLAYLEDVEEELDVDFGDTEFETLNGYLTNILGHIPTDKDVDTSIKAIGYCFTILSIGNKTIGKVKVERDNNVAV